ncbi:cation transport protein-domain-containing protein [Dichomitus squalens]|uniref:Potassium transport protein n=1 Tax=Dichomitus squalens TaxID=114155 RepID=A0A4Q9NIA7_9APHY|nr:cation transport protein-domain-containing protein [Dichomitus squalens]TBU52926.1 cation transport protein-domain-containing protein [Dichomitus squalens]
MPSLHSRMFLYARLGSLKSYIWKHLNFYRVHLLFFTFTPLVFSSILYAANTDFHVSYVDCLFNCVSAMTVCGLATVDLSGLTGLQQALLFIQMCLGSPVLVSLVIVYIRRTFFAKKFQYLVEAELARRAAQQTGMAVDVKLTPWWKKVHKFFGLPWRTRLRSFSDVVVQEPVKRGGGRYSLRPEMIRRVEGAPKLVDPSGWISAGVSQQPSENAIPRGNTAAAFPAESNHGITKERLSTSSGENTDSTGVERGDDHSQIPEQETPERRSSDMSPAQSPGTSPISAPPILRTETVHRQGRGPLLPRTQTVEFAATPQAFVLDRGFSPVASSVEDDVAYGTSHARRSMSRPTMSRRTTSRPTTLRPAMPRSMGTMPRSGTIMTAASHPYSEPPRRTMHRGFGGFPMPHELLGRLFGRAFPQLERRLTRTITIPRTRTIASERGAIPPGSRPVPYISFEAVVGRNSVFQALTQEQLEELGGVEYRALTALLWIVSLYHFGLQLLAFVVIAPYMSIHRWQSDLNPPALHKHVGSAWFSAFQVVSAYTNTGVSLVDQSMIPFQRAYPMVLILPFLILAGNTAFPVFLRFEIWILRKLVPRRSRLSETLHFLLDHPRRCFVYLFPSHQTWFLFTVLLGLTFTDWFFFLVLDIGNPVIEIIPFGIRFLLGFLQATAVRAAGFATVTLSALAPAVKVLYVLMMYVSVYPVAMSVRSTNVYEEKSLGIFNDDDDDSEAGFNPTGNRATVWGRYLAMHARKQLSFDMWWLGLALFLVCIIEKDGLEDEANSSWFNIFNILFELVSAYGTVGLSLGLPNANYSFSGALRPLSKLIICAVMLRGRHRGLPVAIDRAVMLPIEFGDHSDNGFGDEANSTRDYLPRRFSTMDATSEHSLEDLGVGNDRTRTLDRTYTQTQPRSGAPLNAEAPFGRGRDAAPKRVSIHADTMRDLESRVNNVVDQQIHKSGLATRHDMT